MHLDLPPELLPDDYVLVTLDLGEAAIEEVSALPEFPQVFGDAWLNEERTPVLQVPSAIVPESPNFLINPAHAAAVGVRIVRCRGFAFDRRLWLAG